MQVGAVLTAHFELSNYRLTQRSYIGTRDKIELAHDGSIEQTYGLKYAPKTDTVLGHIEFMLKYDDLNLDLLAAVFRKLARKRKITKPYKHLVSSITSINTLYILIP